MSEPKKMTVSQALAEGYTHCGDGEEYFMKIEKSVGLDWGYHGKLYLAEKEGYKYQLSASTIQGLIEGEFESQDEVYDEDLGDNIEDETYQKIADIINAYLTKTYHNISDIQLIPDEPA